MTNKIARRAATSGKSSPFPHKTLIVEDTFSGGAVSLSARNTEVGAKPWAQTVAIWTTNGAGLVSSSTGGTGGWAYFNCAVSTNARYRVVLGSAMADTFYFVFLSSSTVYQHSCIGVFISTTGCMVTSLDASANQTVLANFTGLATAKAGDIFDFEISVGGNCNTYKNGVLLGACGIAGQNGNLVGLGTNANAVISMDSVEVYT